MRVREGERQRPREKEMYTYTHIHISIYSYIRIRIYICRISPFRPRCGILPSEKKSWATSGKTYIYADDRYIVLLI